MTKIKWQCTNIERGFKYQFNDRTRPTSQQCTSAMSTCVKKVKTRPKVAMNASETRTRITHRQNWFRLNPLQRAWSYFGMSYMHVQELC